MASFSLGNIYPNASGLMASNTRRRQFLTALRLGPSYPFGMTVRTLATQRVPMDRDKCEVRSTVGPSESSAHSQILFRLGSVPSNTDRQRPLMYERSQTRVRVLDTGIHHLI